MLGGILNKIYLDHFLCTSIQKSSKSSLVQSRRGENVCNNQFTSPVCNGTSLALPSRALGAPHLQGSDVGLQDTSHFISSSLEVTMFLDTNNV